MRRQDGVTLTELLVAIIIIAILSVVIATNLSSATDAANTAQLKDIARDLTANFVKLLEDAAPGSPLLAQAVVLADDPNLATAIVAALDTNSDGLLRYSEVFAADPVELARSLAPSFGGTPMDPNVVTDQAVQAAVGDYIAGVQIAQGIAGQNLPGAPLAEILADPIRFLLELLVVPLMGWPYLILMALGIVGSGHLVLRRRAKRRKQVSV